MLRSCAQECVSSMVGVDLTELAACLVPCTGKLVLFLAFTYSCST